METIMGSETPHLALAATILLIRSEIMVALIIMVDPQSMEIPSIPT
jgi:hypothetical protein